MKKTDKALIIMAVIAIAFIVLTVGITALFSPRTDAYSIDNDSKGIFMTTEIEEPVRSLVIDFPEYGNSDLTIKRDSKNAVTFPGQYGPVLKTEVNDGVLKVSFPDDFEEYFSGDFTISVADNIESIYQTGETNISISGFKQNDLSLVIENDLFLDKCSLGNVDIVYSGSSWQTFNLLGKASVTDTISVNSFSSDICIATVPNAIKNKVTIVSSENSAEAVNNKDDVEVVAGLTDIAVKFKGPQPTVILKGDATHQIGLYYDREVVIPAQTD